MIFLCMNHLHAWTLLNNSWRILCQPSAAHLMTYLFDTKHDKPTCRSFSYQSASFGKEIPGLDIAHVVFTVEGVGWANPDIIPLMIGNMMVGAWDRGSSNQSANFISPHNQLAAAALNETLCYSYQSFNTCYLGQSLNC